jgi:putative ABC transport system permease protein
MAVREGRSSLRRLALYAGAIALGVGALVAIHSFRADVQRALETEAQALLGADVRIAATQVFSDSINAVLDSLRGENVGVAEATTVVSMVLDTRSEGIRLLQVRAVDTGYPFYGEVETEPAGLWPSLQDQAVALVDPAVLVQLDAQVGDTLAIGDSRFLLIGTVSGLPTEMGFQAAIGPRAFIGRTQLDGTGLLAFGSLARYQAFLEMPDRTQRDAFYERHDAILGGSQINYQTASGQAEDLTFAVDFFSRYLGLIGIAALLLGGIGVGSAVHVYVRERLVSVAVLRCLGAAQGQVFRAYLLQAAALGGAGSLVGVVFGVAVQFVLPIALADLIPVQVTPQVTAAPLIAGALVGAWVSLIFAIGPLLTIRGVPPLLALRHDVEPVGASRGLRALVVLLLVGSMVGITVVEAPSVPEGLGFSLGLAVVGGSLWVVAALLVRLARRFLPRRASYPTRQGLSNLYRPGNQTVAITFALGFGAFIIGTVGLVEANLVRDFSIDGGEDRANMLLFDIQASQSQSVTDLLEAEGARGIMEVPLVPSRLIAINGVLRDTLIALPEETRPEGWALRREYRHTIRGELSPTEELIEGDWWSGAGPGEGLPGISLEADLAESLRVGIGDRITWTFGGVDVETRVASLRVVDWGQFAPNFFVVFEPGSIDDAPQTRMTFARIDGEGDRNRFQRALVREHANVSVLDLSRIQETVDRMLSRVNQAVRFLGAFCTVAGLFVLIGALATTRYQRMREGALLKTLGARRNVVLQVLFTEYAALGILAVSTGLFLAIGSSWMLLTQVFETEFSLHPLRLLVLGVIVTGVTVGVGLLGSRGVLKSPPLQILREVRG